jgi:hypothetical protein
MQAKRRKGRPKLPPEAARRLLIGMTVTADEHRRIKRAAHAQDLSMSAWLRKWALAALERESR